MKRGTYLYSEGVLIILSSILLGAGSYEDDFQPDIRSYAGTYGSSINEGEDEGYDQTIVIEVKNKKTQAMYT